MPCFWRGAEGFKGKIDGNPEIIQGHNSVKSAPVERFEIVGRFADVQQNTADEKSGKNEKQIHARPANGKDGLGELRGCLPRRNTYVVIEENQQDGHAAQAVEFGDSRFRWFSGQDLSL